MIEFKNVNKKFGRIDVLKDVTLDIARGACVVLIGPNGSGKTTLLKCMLNMVIPDRGRIAIDGVDVASGHESRRQIGFMPQIGHFPENMRVEEVIKAIVAIRNWRKPLDDDLYRQFDIQSVGNKKMNTLSGGTVQKVSATIACLFRPEIIVMDEPFAGLDLLAADILRKKILAEKQNGKTILITSHTFGEIETIVSHVVSMDSGSVRFYKPLPELLSATGKENVTDAVMSLLK